MDVPGLFLTSAVKRLLTYKELGDKCLERLSEEDLHFTTNAENNSIAIIIQHLHGNMMSRWSDFLTTDGEKEWRHRDEEFENKRLTKEQLCGLWEEGWKCCIDSIQKLQPNDLTSTIYIRKEPLNVVDAINRQLAHYPYHVGQIVYISKLIKKDAFESLSIPKKR